MSGGVRYTHEALQAAADACTDIDEVVAFLGTRPYGQVQRYLFKRFAHFGIDVSHLRRRSPHRACPPPPHSELRQAVAESTSLAGALRRLGRPDNARTRSQFRQWLAESGISTAHFLGQAHRRGRPGPTPAKSPEQILVKHRGARRTRSVQLRRALRQIGIPERCAECDTAPVWHGKPMTLEVDHINGDWSDDRAENLRLLCPNCHAITTTWCRGGRPVRNGRKGR
ncbi:HNH endonuclease signature motif containing protein [Streptomyces sp. NRRL S-1813]|uniref:HNH endonuclease signature motif containing protein n=1 Tax=Streptomyces sp. NRRL S-1813 TaxID=1463888 RepID=UPI000562B974|nr:HNH endonuclease signature motif containing protein [Streptomyces sp. NRRL S-1813]